MTECSCSRVCGIFMQIMLLASLILYLLTLFIEIKIASKTMLIILIIVYVLYLITEFCSPTFSFLCSKTNKDEFVNSLSQLIKSNPIITILFSGNRYLVNIKEHLWGSKNFPYYSSRDVSGLLELNISKNSFKDKAYAALEIQEEINFADEISYLDLVRFKNVLDRIYPDFDLSISDERKLPSYKSYHLVRIAEKEPCTVNIIFYILFTIIPIVEIYKCYINSYIYEKTFVIRKLISTRYDLNQDKYQNFIPYIKILGQEYSFDSNDYNYINSIYNVKPPTENEINVASQFNNKVPKYECESFINIKDEIKIGIVKDEPNYREESNGIYHFLNIDFSKIKDKINDNIDDNLNNNMNNNKVYIYNGAESKENLNLNEDLGNINNLNLNPKIKREEETKNANENDIINSKNQL